MELSEGFPPVAPADAQILVLGSLPGKRSLAVQEYYAHPQNAFWRIMQEIYGIAGDYDERCAGLMGVRLALWDVLRESARRGSLDADIQRQTAAVNDFDSFLSKHADIGVIAFNGKKAEQLFRAMVPKKHYTSLRLLSLPSTSPAYAAMPLQKKISLWTAGLSNPDQKNLRR